MGLKCGEMCEILNSTVPLESARKVDAEVYSPSMIRNRRPPRTPGSGAQLEQIDHG
jgi:hypothetical protein